MQRNQVDKKYIASPWRHLNTSALSCHTTRLPPLLYWHFPGNSWVTGISPQLDVGRTFGDIWHSVFELDAVYITQSTVSKHCSKVTQSNDLSKVMTWPHFSWSTTKFLTEGCCSLCAGFPMPLLYGLDILRDIISGVLLKMDVGIRNGAWQRAWRYPAYLWSLR